MTVTAIRLQNFMAFGEVEDDNEGWIELRSISLLYGRNSSGKSTIIRALRLLKQSLTETPEGARFAFNVEDGLNAGNHASIIHGSNLDRFSYHIGEDDWEDWIKTKNEHGEEIEEKKKKTVDFAFALSVPSEKLRNFLPSSELEISSKQIRLTLKFGWMVVEKIFDLISFTLEIPSHNPIDNRIIFEGGRLSKSNLADEMGNWWFGGDSLVEFVEPENLIIWRMLEVQFTYGFLPQLFTPRIARRWITRDVTHIAKLFEDINIEIKNFLDNIQYVRPIRPEPQRDYVLNASEVKSWERRGLQAYLKLLRNAPDLPDTRLNTWLSKLQLGTFIIPVPSEDTPEGSIVSKIMIREKGSDFEINLSDIGFGASQVIPILVESLLTNEHSIVIIEQPELHLHPEAQAMLADLFIECTTTQGSRFLIETHSEHILLRLRRRIVERTANRISQERGFERTELNALFVNRVKGISSLFPVDINDFGDLLMPSKLPKQLRGFFSSDLEDMLKLTRATLDAKNQQGEANVA